MNVTKCAEQDLEIIIFIQQVQNQFKKRGHNIDIGVGFAICQGIQ